MLSCPLSPLRWLSLKGIMAAGVGIFLLGMTGCADDPPADDMPPQPDDPFEVILPPLEAANEAEAVVMSWFAAAASGDLRAAARWMHPADTGDLARRLRNIQPPPRPAGATLENVVCPDRPDSLRCLLAFSRRDQLLMDSVLLLRRDDRWLIHLYGN